MALNATLTPFPADFEVWEVRFSDRMNQPFELCVLGASTAPGVDLRALLGQRVTLSLPDEVLLSSVHGIVRRAGRHTPEPSGVTVYELHVAPPEWVLSKRTNSRIFQNLTAAEIVRAILREHPVTTAPSIFTRALAVREYCVQYDETDLDFARRLLAEEGIGAYFDHGAGGRFCLVDDTTLQKPPQDSELTAQANTANLKPGGLAVLRWRAEQAIETIAAARRDHDFERPKLGLEEAEAPLRPSSAAETSLESYSYEPDRLLHTGDDGKHAARDLEALRALSSVVHLETNFAAAAGTSLRVGGEELGGDWFVIESSVSLQSSPAPGGGIAARRAIALTAIPLGVPYRPPHRKRPLIFGTQSARVVGATPEGTVDVDEHGRVHVELRWDRRELWARGEPGKENPTRRVRVAQAWAGAGYGFVTLPRVGDEVLVAYEDGNPDRPVVIGRVHDAVSRTPLDLPDAHKTLSVWKSQSFGPSGPVEGFNLIAMQDDAGAELLQVQAQLDFAANVGRDATTVIGRDETTSIGGNQVLAVNGSQSVRVGGQSLGAGHQAVRLGGNYSLECKEMDVTARGMRLAATNGNLELVAVGERLDVSGTKHHFESPSIFMKTYDVVQVVTPNFHVFAESEIHLQVGGSSIHVTAGGIEIKSSGDVKVNGAAVKLNC